MKCPICKLETDMLRFTSTGVGCRQCKPPQSTEPKYIIRNQSSGSAVQFNDSERGYEFVDDAQATLFDSPGKASLHAQNSTLHRWGSYDIVPFQHQQSLI